jgi:hypothetical protein
LPRSLPRSAAKIAARSTPTGQDDAVTLYVFGVERMGVVISDLHFADPTPAPGQEGAERGVRLELRMLERGELKGSIYSAQPIAVGRPIWRVDLLETVAGEPGSFDRAHHHPAFNGWEPGSRHFVEELTADPLRWLEARLSDVPGVLETAGVARDEIDASDVERLHKLAPEIVAAVRRLLDEVRANEVGRLGDGGELAGARVGWL